MSEKDILIDVASVSKKFSKDLKSTMIYGMQDVLRIVLGMRIHNRSLRKNEFWALDEFSLRLHRGEILGVMGVNGAGKTTLIRLITGIYPLDKGSISIYGRISSLYAVTAGMNPLCSGRENIYLRMAMYGLGHAEVNGIIDELIAFAELGEFIDAPLGTYSSGMRARLGFSVALFSNPDILIIDEGLAVGDIAFRSKCFKALRDIRFKTATIIVSHSISQISNMATRIMVMDKGRLTFETSNVAEGVEYYIRNCVTRADDTFAQQGILKLNKVSLSTDAGPEQEGEVFTLQHLEKLRVTLDMESHTAGSHAVLSVEISDRNKNIIAVSDSLHSSFLLGVKEGPLRVEMELPELPLSPGTYYISVTVREKETEYPLLMAGFVKSFTILGQYYQEEGERVKLRSLWRQTR